MGRGNRGNASDEGTQSSGEDEPTQQKKTTKLPRPEGKYPCPRCASENTKFCYYNNYNIKQPRFYCKACQRYWTVGGTLRNLPPGSGKRKSKSAKGGDFEKPSASNFDGTPPATNTSTSMFLHSQNTTNQLAALAAAQVNSGLLQDHTSVLNMQAAAAQQQLLSDPALNALKNMQAQGLAGWGDLGLLGGAGQVEARALLGLGNYDNSGGAGVAAQLQQAHGVQQQQLLMQQFGLDDGDVHGRRVRPKQDPDANASLSPLSMGLGSNGALNGLQSDGKDVHIKPSASPTSSLLQQHQQAALLQHQHQQQQQAALLQHHIMNEQLQRNALLQQQQQHAALLGVSPWLGGGLGGAGGLGVDLMGANGAALLAQGTSGLELMGAKNAMSNVAAMQLAGAQAQAQNTAAAQLMAAQQGGLWAVNGLGVWPNAAATTLYGNAAMYGQVPGRGL